jgi:site-specific DNA-methyltransferase (adenine-specific)
MNEIFNSNNKKITKNKSTKNILTMDDELEKIENEYNNTVVNKEIKTDKKIKKNKSTKNILIADNKLENEFNNTIENKENKEIKMEIKTEKKIKKSISNKQNVIENNLNQNGGNKTIKIQLFNNDCMKELEKIEDESIDCIITDPPYFIDKLDNNWSSKEIKEDKKNSHIKHLPKGMKFDKEQVKNLYEFYFELSKILIKKIKPGGYFLSFSSPRLYHSIAMGCELAGFEIRDMINWVYTQSMSKGMSVNHIIEKMNKTKDEKEKIKKEYENFKTPMIRSCFEPICVAMKPVKGTFIQNELNFKTGLINFDNKVGKDKDRVPANIITTEEINDSYDKNFLISKPNKEEKGEYNTHITVKPLAIIEHLIKIFSKEKSIILDPFMGSGTTGICCKKNNRNFIGIELNKEYFNIAKKRIDEII